MKARIFRDFDKIDTLSNPATVPVRGDHLKAGMVLVDDLGCPITGLDHKVAAVRGTGTVQFMAADLEQGGWNNRSFNRNKSFQVVAA